MKTSYILISVFITLVFSGCALDLFKDMDVCHPVVEIVSAEMTGDYSARITAEITDLQAFAVEYNGFASNQTGNPSIHHNQILVDPSNETFTVEISDLKPDSTYFFKAFIASQCGLFESPEVSLTVPIPLPPVPVCNLSDNVIINNMVQHDVGFVSFGEVYADEGGDFGVHISAFGSSGPTVELEFFRLPINGVYTINDQLNTITQDRDVIVDLHSGWNYYSINEGEVYVENNDNQTLTITFCDLPYTFSSHQLFLSGKAIFDL